LLAGKKINSGDLTDFLRYVNNEMPAEEAKIYCLISIPALYKEY
jgi:allophanate hydrolase subunit 1